MIRIRPQIQITCGILGYDINFEPKLVNADKLLYILMLFIRFLVSLVLLFISCFSC